MKGLKSLRLPNWIIKYIQHGEENEELNSLLLDIGIFYLLGFVVLSMYDPFGSDSLALEIICEIAICPFLILLGYWLVVQVALLDSLRKEALILYKNSKTRKEAKDAHSRLKKLWVPIPTAA